MAADKTLRLANFKYGLDSRRADLVSQPGTLQVCENGYINAGGEVEKRYTFYYAGVPFPPNTFGLQDVEAGMETYGSDATPSPLPLPGDGLIVYRQLVHPAVSEGAFYVPEHHDLIQIVDSCNAEGKSFVIAKFADGNSFLYYDAVLIESSRNGLVLTGVTTLSDLAIQLAAQINAIGLGWIAVPNEDENGDALEGAVTITSPSGTYFTPIPDDSGSVDGVIGQRFVDKDFAGVAGNRATARFEVTAVGSPGTTWDISAPKNQDGSGTVFLMDQIVVVAQTILELATAIAAGINSQTFIHGYISDTDGVSTVFVYSPLEWGADANTFDLTVDIVGDGTVGTSTVDSSLQIFVNPSYVYFTKVGTGPTRILSDAVTASAIGGVPDSPEPYTYAWSVVSQGDAAKPIAATSPNSAVTRFQGSLQPFGDTTAVFKCTVTDGAATTDEVNINVTLSLESNN